MDFLAIGGNVCDSFQTMRRNFCQPDFGRRNQSDCMDDQFDLNPRLFPTDTGSVTSSPFRSSNIISTRHSMYKSKVLYFIASDNIYLRISAHDIQRLLRRPILPHYLPLLHNFPRALQSVTYIFIYTMQHDI
jgi:hypothetical protein